MKDTITRREIIRRSIVSGGLAALLGTRAFAETCDKTQAQGEGPFYPEKELNRDNDLTRLAEGLPRATGQVIYIEGEVRNEACKPVPGALVEVWQAAHTGKYNHSGDTTTLKLDPNFQYWGRTRTDAKGRYEFLSIIPGHYPVGGGHYRPPHIHYKVHAAGHVSLTTQMYFTPSSFSDPELAKIVTKLNQIENVPDSLKVHFVPGGPEADSLTGRFDITIKAH